MSRIITIDGYDFSNDIDRIPALDSPAPEWGQVESNIINSQIKFTLPISFLSFFQNGRELNKILVEITNNGIIEFSGVIDEIDFTENKIIIGCKSFTTILFNSYITADKFAYVLENAYPIDIIVEIIDLGEEIIKAIFPDYNLQLNANSYQKAYNIQSQNELRFTVFAEKINYADIINKICEVTCGIIYMRDNEFHYEMFETDIPSSIELTTDDLITYPKIDNPSSFNVAYSGTDIRFGSDLSLMDIYGENSNKASKVINMAISSGDLEVSTNSISTAHYIKESYDYIGNNKRKQIEVDVRKELENIIKIGSYVEWENIKYRVMSINKDSDLKLFIRGEAITL